jgi:hypothetical protein
MSLLNLKPPGLKIINLERIKGMITKFIKKPYSFLVDAPDASYLKRFELDKNVKLVRGIVITSNKDHLLYYRGSQKIEISGTEIFPDEYESKLLMSGIGVAPDEKYADLGDEVLAGNGEVKVLYKDTSNSSAVFEPYKVSIYLICELG